MPDTATQLSIGFFAAWHNKESEFRAGPEEERETGARIHAAFTHGQSLGIRMLGMYGCRWSSDQQYFTFWLCPNLEALEATIDRLESAGDFKFADSLHLIGRLLPGATENPPLPVPPLAAVTFWSPRPASSSPAQISEAVHQSAQVARQQYAARGVWSPGLFESHWSSGWAFFSLWTAHDLATFESLLDDLEADAVRARVELGHTIGQHAPQFRFGTRLQPLDGG
jgi:hypothetical protein